MTEKTNNINSNIYLFSLFQLSSISITFWAPLFSYYYNCPC